MADTGRALGKELGMFEAAPDERVDDTSTDVVARVMGSLIGTFFVAAFAFLGYLGFAGGHVPLVGWHLPGGILPGVLWLGVLATAGVVVVWFVPVAVGMVLYRPLSRLFGPRALPRRRAPARRRASRPKAA